MKTVLLAWELGGGLGHLVQLRAIAEGLTQRGHRVVAALRELSQAKNVLGASVATLYQAPIKTILPAPFARLPMTFAHILQDNGFGDAIEASQLADAWRTLYREMRPDLIVFDHAPMALLAARGLPVKRVLIGSGFCIPPDESPLPNLRAWKDADQDILAEDERTVLGTANGILQVWREHPLERITQIYSEVDETLLVTLAELDHYPGRAGARYSGPLVEAPGAAPQWPSGIGKRIYAYLKMVPALPRILNVFQRTEQPTIVVLDRGHESMRRFTCKTLRVEAQRLDIGRVAAECDLAILNANHGTTAAILLAGKPILQLPVYLEQALLARAMVTGIGAGLDAGHRDPNQVRDRLEKMLATNAYAEAARGFAAKYAGFDPVRQKQQILARLEELLQ